MTEPNEQNRQSALAFYDLVFNKNQPRQAVDLYVGETYTQHNPEVGEGKTAFVRYCEWLNKTYPGKRAEFLTTCSDGEIVVVYTRQIWPGESEYQAVDFFRFDTHGKIVEHWDVVQEITTNE